MPDLLQPIVRAKHVHDMLQLYSLGNLRWPNYIQEFIAIDASLKYFFANSPKKFRAPEEANALLSTILRHIF